MPCKQHELDALHHIFLHERQSSSPSPASAWHDAYSCFGLDAHGKRPEFFLVHAGIVNAEE